MSPSLNLSRLFSLIALFLSISTALPAQTVTALETQETVEIVFNPSTSSYAQPLNTMAQHWVMRSPFTSMCIIISNIRPTTVPVQVLSIPLPDNAAAMSI